MNVYFQAGTFTMSDGGAAEDYQLFPLGDITSASLPETLGTGGCSLQAGFLIQR